MPRRGAPLCAELPEVRAKRARAAAGCWLMGALLLGRRATTMRRTGGLSKVESDEEEDEEPLLSLLLSLLLLLLPPDDDEDEEPSDDEEDEEEEDVDEELWGSLSAGVWSTVTTGTAFKSSAPNGRGEPRALAGGCCACNGFAALPPLVAKEMSPSR